MEQLTFHSKAAGEKKEHCDQPSDFAPLIETPPPQYEEIERQSDYFSRPVNPPSTLRSSKPNSRNALAPAVIPQLKVGFKGPLMAPFVRAYPSEYAARGISKETFIAFIDGFNEAFMANPAFQLTAIAGDVMGSLYGISGELMIAGMVISTAARLGTVATSVLRAKAFVRQSNEAIFHPAGLSVKVLKTKAMCAAVKYPTGKLALLPKEDDSVMQSTSSGLSEWETTPRAYQTPDLQTHARQEFHTSPSSSFFASPSGYLRDRPNTETIVNRRLTALEPYVLPLDFDVPQQDPTTQGNLMKRWGEHQVRRTSSKQERKLGERESERAKKHRERLGKAEEEQTKMQKELAKLEKDLRKESHKRDKELRKSHKESDRQKAEKEFQKKKREIDREVADVIDKGERKVAEILDKAERKRNKTGKDEQKEDKRETEMANKVRWIVISEWDGEEEEEDSSESDEATKEV